MEKSTPETTETTETQQTTTAQPDQLEEEKKEVTETTSALKQPSEETGSIKDNLMSMFNQLNQKGMSQKERRQLEFLKQLMPLYEKHQFWDT